VTVSKPLDTTTKLWDYLYKVRVPYIQSRHIGDIREHGVRVSGIKEVDKDIINQWFTTMLPISTMAEYYKEGVAIRICSTKDVKEIYESISAHIHAWKTRLERGINIGDAPIDDLILLDKFANSIYEHAKYQFTQETVDSIMTQQLSKLQRITAQNFFNTKSMLNPNASSDGITRINADDPDKPNYPERDELGEFFKTRLINLRRS